jgi:ribonuclease E
MERRRKAGGKARLLYSESDLLVRCLRDVLTSETDEVIIDNEQALTRAERFMKIVSPRTKTKLMHAPGKTPIFHAFGIERQIALIHAREVPLPSGGRLVIDQTEALVAIDVNSGKSRDARDAEDNAYKTNLEAANSRIYDVDVAAETTKLARANILVQSGAAMLSQANAASQIALKLLQ